MSVGRLVGQSVGNQLFFYFFVCFDFAEIWHTCTATEKKLHAEMEKNRTHRF